MNWPMLIGALIVGWIGWALMDDAKNSFGKTFGFFLVLLAGALAWHASGFQPLTMDEKSCAQYAWIDERWKCVPWEQGG